MSWLSNKVSQIAGGAADIVSSGVSAIGNAGQGIIDTAKGTVKNFLDNPLPVLETAVLIAVGVPPIVAQAAVGAANGQSMEQIAINAAVAYGGQQIGQAAGNAYSGVDSKTLENLGPQYADEALIKQIVTSSSGAAAATALKGGDFTQILNSGLSGGVNSLVAQQLKAEGLDPSDTKLVASATSAATNAILNGKSISSAIGNSVAATALGTAIGGKVDELTKGSETVQSIAKQFEDLQKSAAEFFTTNKLDTLQTQAQKDYETAQAARTNYTDLASQYEYQQNKYTSNANAYTYGMQYAQTMGALQPLYEAEAVKSKAVADAALAKLNDLAPKITDAGTTANTATTKYQDTLALLTPLQEKYTQQYVTPLNDYGSQIDTLNTSNTALAQQLGTDVTKYQEQLGADAAQAAKDLYDPAAVSKLLAEYKAGPATQVAQADTGTQYEVIDGFRYPVTTSASGTKDIVVGTPDNRVDMGEITVIANPKDEEPDPEAAINTPQGPVTDEPTTADAVTKAIEDQANATPETPTTPATPETPTTPATPETPTTPATPETPTTPATPETPTTPATTAGVTSSDVSKIVNDALAANPGITSSDVSKIVSDAMAANPGITAGQVKSAVDSGIAGVKTDLASVTAAQQAAAQQAAQQAAAQAASDAAAKANAAKAAQGQRANSVLAVLSLMQGQQTAQQAQQAAQSNTPYTPPPLVDIGNQLDLGYPLQTNPFAKQKTATKMARGGSIDDLLAILKRG